MNPRQQSKTWTLALAVAGTLSCCLAGAVEFESLYYSVESFNRVATSRHAVADVDADGVSDLVFAAKADTEDALLVVGKRATGEFGVKQKLLLPTGTNAVRILADRTGDRTSVLAVGSNGVAHVYAGWPLSLARSFAVASGAGAAAVGDVDANGTQDLVVSTSTGLKTYDVATGNLVRSSFAASGGSDVALAQLDADAALEVIVGGTVPGLVLDGATNALDWSYIDGFGLNLATGQLGTIPTTSWVGANGWYRYNVFRSSPWSPLWTGITQRDIGAIATLRNDSAGRDDIVYGDGQSLGNIRIVDSVTRQQRLAIPNPGYGVNAITSGDFDGDGSVDIAFSPAGAIYEPALVIANSVSGAVLWSFKSEYAPPTQTEIGDVDGDGRLELVTLDFVQSQSVSVNISDFLTGEEEWRSANDPSGLLNFSISRMKLVPNPAAPGMGIVLAGTNNSGAAFVVLDGTTKAVSAHPGQLGTTLTTGGRMIDIELLDYDHDGVQDFVMVGAASGTHMFVFSGIDGTPLRVFPQVAPSSQGARKVLVVGRDSMSPQLVVVLWNGLQAYDAQSGIPTWSVTSSNDGACVIPQGINGEEIAIFKSNGLISIISASTQAVLRSIAVKSPLIALTALDEPTPTLLAKSAGMLTLVDGVTGTIGATTEYLGTFVDVAPGTFRASDSFWYVAAGTKSALYRKRLVLNEHIFTSTFDSSP